MKLTLAALIGAFFVVMGELNEGLRQYHLVIDKRETLVVSENQLALGLKLNTRNLSVTMTSTYLSKVLSLLQSTLHGGRKYFIAIEVLKLT